MKLTVSMKLPRSY